MSKLQQITINWAIKRKPIPIPTLSQDSYNYTGSQITAGLLNYSEDEIDLSGTTQATNADDYTITVTPKKNWCWPDGTYGEKTLTWSISGIPVSVPSQSGTLTYSGSAQSPTWTGYDSTKLTLGGITSGTNAGSYIATFTPKTGYIWPDGTMAAKNVTWNIGRATIATVPTQNGTLTYNGSVQNPSWNNYDTAKLTLAGTTSSTNAGTFTAQFTPTGNYQWSDGSITAKNVSWTIGKMTLTVPSQSGTLTYSGSSQSPSWSNYNTTYMTLGGTTSGTNAGSYNASFTLKNTTNTQWTGATTDAKTVAWSIGKAAGSLSINPTSLSFSETGSSHAKTVAVTSLNSGPATASSNATNIATTSVNGKVVTVTPIADGNATITIGIPTDTNYLAPASQTCAVTVESLYTGPSKDATAAQFHGVIAAGQGPNSFVVGDIISVPISWTFGKFTMNSTQYPQILGFNHNQPTEGTGNYVDVQFAINENKTILYSYYSDEFKMSANTSGGGYNGTYMAQQVCPSFLLGISNDWQAFVIDANKYTDNVGGSANTASNVTGYLYKIWLVSVYEVFGTTTHCNPSEANFQKQYQLYINGGSKYRNSYTSGDSAPTSVNTYAGGWILRSPSQNNGFCGAAWNYGSQVQVQLYSASATPCKMFTPCCRIA